MSYTSPRTADRRLNRAASPETATDVALRDAEHLARASRELAASLEESAVRDTVRRLTLPRPGTWSIVDVIEPSGLIQRLPVMHPDPAKNALAHSLEGPWMTALDEAPAPTDLANVHVPIAVTHNSGAALMRAAHGEENLRILSEIGFGALLVIPLIARARILGAMTFVSREGGATFSADEIAMAVDLAARCAMALDNARMHREAEASRLAAVSANLAKSAFLGSMSHELRTPLNAIGGYTELLDLGIAGPVTEEQHVAIARIKANQEHLLTLIAEVLTFVAAEPSKPQYATDGVSMTQAMHDVIEMLGGAASDRGLTIASPTGSPDVTGWADASRVRQILVNLVMNAVKYTPRNGGTITLTCVVDGNRILVTVADTGPGIPPEKLELIFEPFVQLTSGLANRRGAAARRNVMARTVGNRRMITARKGPREVVELTTDTRHSEALLQAGALQSAIFNSANFSSIATDAKGVIQIFNVGAERMLGYTAAEVVNKITPADISDPQELIARAKALSLELGTAITPGFEALVFKASRGIEDIYELTYFRKDGSRFPAVVSVTALRDAEDTIIGYLLIGTDNTARKQAEEALLKAGALQSAIFNSANFSSIATDAKGVIQIFNVGAERMLGYAAADVMNKITPADISDPQEVVARAKTLSAEFGTPIAPGFEALVFKASRGIEDIYELTYFRKDGSRFPAVVSVTALRDAQETIIGYLLIGTDNTARKQVEEERRKLDQRLRDQHFYTRSLIESNIDALMTCDPRGIITDVNKQTEALTGCTRDELIGAPFKNYFTDSGRAEAGINRVLTEGKVTNYELTARARDGTLTVVSYNATTFHDRDRVLQGVFAAARDMTELKSFELTLRQKNAELEDASRMKSEFLANMSHELRTPLNAIIGFSEVLRDGLLGDMTDKQRGFIGDIFSSGKHLLALINDILDLSKVEAGKMSLDLEHVQLSSLFANSLSIIREKAALRHINLEMDIGKGLDSPRLDGRKVKQIVYNLLSNAVKFTSESGEVTLRASLVSRADVGQLSASWAGRSFPLPHGQFENFIEICVSDSGMGISPDGMQRLFKPFSQIDTGLARKFEGTGLGLAMVKLLAELHGGTVAVESAEGEGSRFRVWLPIRDADEALPVVPRPAAPASVMTLPGERTALVVEDDFKSADLIRVQLEAEGFKVLHAATAEAALELAEQQPLTLITLDIMLPGMDGWEFLTRVKQLPTLTRIPVVIISIVADPNRGFALGAAAVMQKPISRQELYDSLHQLGLFPIRHGETLKVLIVDDDPKAVDLLAIRVGELATTVLRAYGGREAIEIATRERPDLIILDLMMPEVSGFDVVDALNLHSGTSQIPVIVVTAKHITNSDRARLNGYVTAIMAKAGLDPDRFTAEVRRAVAVRRVSA